MRKEIDPLSCENLLCLVMMSCVIIKSLLRKIVVIFYHSKSLKCALSLCSFFTSSRKFYQPLGSDLLRAVSAEVLIDVFFFSPLLQSPLAHANQFGLKSRLAQALA